ncbi:hypothetical protein Pfo_013809, partial [Paulownia fortunei]
IKASLQEMRIKKLLLELKAKTLTSAQTFHMNTYPICPQVPSHWDSSYSLCPTLWMEFSSHKNSLFLFLLGVGFSIQFPLALILANRPNIFHDHHPLGNHQYVFTFGVILLNLISMRVYTEEKRQISAPSVYQWAWREFEAYDHDSESDLKKPKFLLIHRSLAAKPDFDPVDGHKITTPAIECTNGDGYERHTMKQVLRSLLKLKIAKKHVDFLGVNKTCLWLTVGLS